MELHAKVWKYGDDVDTDVIIPARHLNTIDPVELGKHCMEDLDADFIQKISAGDIIAAGKNFGCGSSREHAPIAIKAAGISCVVAKSFARIFYRNSINIGLPIIELGEAVAEINEGDVLRIDLDKGFLKNETQQKQYQLEPFPPFIQEIMSAGGLIAYVKERVASNA
jgi:3-isopropylmalate/(R)-2-methylmalate dehydratase small subunit